MKKKKILSLIVCILIPTAVGALAAFLSRSGRAAYGDVLKPPFTPPAFVFPVVWTLLYVLMGIASWIVWNADTRENDKKSALRLYARQLVFNFFWPLIFFELGAYYAAFLVLLALFVFVLQTAVAFGKISRPAAGLLLPYVLWLALAAYLNLGVAVLN